MQYSECICNHLKVNKPTYATKLLASLNHLKENFFSLLCISCIHPLNSTTSSPSSQYKRQPRKSPPDPIKTHTHTHSRACQLTHAATIPTPRLERYCAIVRGDSRINLAENYANDLISRYTSRARARGKQAKGVRSRAQHSHPQRNLRHRRPRNTHEACAAAMNISKRCRSFGPRPRSCILHVRTHILVWRCIRASCCPALSGMI